MPIVRPGSAKLGPKTYFPESPEGGCASICNEEAVGASGGCHASRGRIGSLAHRRRGDSAGPPRGAAGPLVASAIEHPAEKVPRSHETF